MGKIAVYNCYYSHHNYLSYAYQNSDFHFVNNIERHLATVNNKNKSNSNGKNNNRM